jgi:hypothetical protein
MPLRTIVRTKDEGKEHDKEKPSEMDEDESNHNTAFSKSGIVSAIRKTIAKYTISRPHSPVNSRPAVSHALPGVIRLYLILSFYHSHPDPETQSHQMKVWTKMKHPVHHR